MSEFPYKNRAGRVMYDANGNCVNCGHHARLHHRGCARRGHWQPDRQCYSGPCSCHYESPEQDRESAIAGALWRAFAT